MRLIVPEQGERESINKQTDWGPQGLMRGQTPKRCIDQRKRSHEAHNQVISYTEKLNESQDF